MLREFLVSNGIRTEHAEADADVMIANTGIALAENYPTIIIGEDTDVLVLPSISFKYKYDATL